MNKLVDGVEVPLTQEEIEEMLMAEEEHKQKLEAYEAVRYRDQRKEEYPTLEEMIVGLIEKEEGRPEVLNELMLRRTQVKNKYHKPE